MLQTRRAAVRLAQCPLICQRRGYADPTKPPYPMTEDRSVTGKSNAEPIGVCALSKHVLGAVRSIDLLIREEIVAALPLFTLRPLADMDPATTPIIPSLLRNTLVYGPFFFPRSPLPYVRCFLLIFNPSARVLHLNRSPSPLFRRLQILPLVLRAR